MIIGTFILDFQTVNFESDSEIAKKMLSEFQDHCQLHDAFALDDPFSSAGWSFSKLFLTGEFVEKLYGLHGHEVDRSKGKRFADKFISWLGEGLKSKNCSAQLKVAREMIL